MLVFGATLILPTLPFVVALLAYVPLIEVTLDFSDNLGPDPRTVEAFGLAILGVYALVLVFSRGKRGSIVFIVTTTLFLAWLNLSRQGLISQKLVLDAMLMALLLDSQVCLGASGVQGIAASRRRQLRTALAIAVSFPVAFSILRPFGVSLTLRPAVFVSAFRITATLFAVYQRRLCRQSVQHRLGRQRFQVNYMTFRMASSLAHQWKAVIEPPLFDEFARRCGGPDGLRSQYRRESESGSSGTG
jgi:hypothetical protein